MPTAKPQAKLYSVQFDSPISLFNLGTRNGVTVGQDGMELTLTGTGVKVTVPGAKRFYVIPVTRCVLGFNEPDAGPPAEANDEDA